MKGRLFEFAEGTMTIRQFMDAHCPCLSENTVRAHLKAGRNSAQLMLTYSPNMTAARRKGLVNGLRSKAKARFGKGPGRFR